MLVSLLIGFFASEELGDEGVVEGDIVMFGAWH